MSDKDDKASRYKSDHPGDSGPAGRGAAFQGSQASGDPLSRMNYQYQGPYPGYDSSQEISLIDILKIFARRRRLFFLSFILFVVLGVAASLHRSSHYTYQKIVNVPMALSLGASAPAPVVSVPGILASFKQAKLQQWIQQNRHYATALKLKKGATGSILISVKGSARGERKVQALLQDTETFIHSESSKQMLNWLRGQQAILERDQQQYALLQQRFKKMQESISSASMSQAQELYMAQLSTEIESLKTTAMQQKWLLDHQIPYAVDKLLYKDPVGLGRVAMLLVAILLSIVMACVAVFVVHFISSVRKQLKES